MARESRHERPVRRGRVDDTGGDAEGGEKLYYHLTLLAEIERGLPQPDQAVVGRLSSRATTTSPASTGSCSSATTKGSSPPPGASAASCSRRCWPATTGPSPQEGGAAPGHLRPRQPLRRAPGPRPPRAAQDQPGAGRDRPRASARRCSRPTTATTPTARTHVAHDALLCVQTGALHRRPEAVQVRGRGALPEVGGRDAPAVRRAARGVRQHAADRRAGQRRDRVRRPSAARVPRPARVHAGHVRGAGRRLPAPPHLRRAPRSATAHRCPRRSCDAARLRARRHRRHGVLRLLPRRVGPHPLRPRRAGIRVGPGRGLGGRMLRRLLPADRRPRPDPLRPAVRAVPEPGPQADARHRHGLRRALPGAR